MKAATQISCSLITVLLLFTQAQAQKAVLTITDSTWGNTGVQTVQPAAFIMSFGVCVAGSANCIPDGGSAMSNLSPLMFYPSNCPQKVTIRTGPAFEALATVFAQSSDLNTQLPRIVSNDGSIPSDFFTNNQSNGGNVRTGRAGTISLIVVQVSPFSFQPVQTGQGEIWEALAKDGSPATMTITVY
jgi:hypothetical protein